MIFSSFAVSPRTYSRKEAERCKLIEEASVMRMADLMELPFPMQAHLNSPWTVIEWADRDKDKVRCSEDDEYDPVFGLMWCALHKVTRNRVRVSDWEPVIGFLAENLATPDEMRMVSRMLSVTADAMELDGVAEAIEEYDGAGEVPQEARQEAPQELTDEALRSLEETRAELRRLMDLGEI